MVDISLYRKYRPQNFTNLVGQDHVRKTLLNAIKGGHLSHAYLFCGPRGTGKTTSARLVAKAINCISPAETGESCNKCEYCVLVNERRLMDIIEIDAASNRGIDEIRDLREKIKFAPNQAPHKVYIIDEVHMLTTPAFNALLKTLEEPPAHAYFILATTESHKVPETIISRCQRFDFHRIEEPTIVDRLKHIAQQEKVSVEAGSLEMIARTAEGGMRDAISAFEQIMSEDKLTLDNVIQILGISGHESIEKLHDALQKRDAKTALNAIQAIHQEGHDLYQFNRDLLDHLRKRLLESLGKKEETQQYLYWIELFQTSSSSLKNSVIPQLPLEIAAIKSCLFGQDEHQAGWLENFLGGNKKETVPKAAPQPVATTIQEKKVVKEAVTASATPPATKATAKKEGMKSIPAESQPNESVVPSSPGEPLSIEQVREKWPRILECIPKAAVRQSFKTSLLSHVEGNEVTVDYQSKFHMDKVEEIANKSLVENAFNKIFGSSVKVIGKLVSMNNVVDDAVEIFGGEVIDDFN